MNLPTHFSNPCKILLSKTWPYAVWKTTSFCLFCVFFLLVLFDALPRSSAGTHSEFPIPAHCLHALRFYLLLSYTSFSYLFSSPHLGIFTEESSLNYFLCRSNFALFDYVFCLFLNLLQFSCILSV